MPGSHPNGSRTFATLIRDAIPLPEAVIDRLMALDAGHPTLTELRAALGVDLDLTPANDAGRAAWPANPTPGDADLARVLDAMYGAVTSSRLVRLEITEGGATPSGTEGSIVMRGQELFLWVLADNKTDAHVHFSVNGSGHDVARHRTGSTVVNAEVKQAGAHVLPLTIVVDGRETKMELPIESRAAGKLRVSLIDDSTGEPVAARVYLRDELGAAWPAGATVRRDAHGNVFFHAQGSFEAAVCGMARLRVVRGIEYEAAEREITVACDAEVETSVRCRRWSHEAAEGWYSGDVHVHLHYGGEYLLEPADAALVQRAEDVHFLNMMVANQGSGWVHDVGNFGGADHELSDGAHILRWGEEYRNNFYGHMCMFGIKELVPPIYSGFPNSEHAHDMPANADAAEHCHSVAGTVSYAHPVFQSIELDRVFAPEHRLSVEAKELPVDAALGHIDAVDVLSYPASTTETCGLWYRLLNCGLRLAATVGTDTFMNFYEVGALSNPPAGDRVFVRVEGPFTTESWCEGVRAGRTFVTNGPTLSLDVAGHGIGEEIAVERGRVLRVQGAARSSVPIDRIELVVNGEVVAFAEANDSGRRASLTHDLRVDESCWLALRATGGKHELVLDPDGAFAHTSPVYVTVGGASIAGRDDGAYFVEWIERLIAVTEARARFPSDAARDGVIALFRRGQMYYRALADGATG